MKRLILALIVVAGFAIPASAVDITITFTNATPAEVVAANWYLAKTNAVRVAHNDEEGNPLEPFASIKELIIDRIKTSWLPSWIQQQAEATQQEADLKTLWKNATPATRAQAVALLQGS